MLNTRASGVLAHITSFDTKYGIGDLGNVSQNFIAFLKKAGMNYWQVLPLNPIFLDPSPYASISSLGFNFFLIDLDALIKMSLLNEDIPTVYTSDDLIDFNKIFSYKKLMLRKAFDNLNEKTNPELHHEFMEYIKENEEWLHDFALFISLKEHFMYKRLNDRKNGDFKDLETFKEMYKDKLNEDDLEKYYYGATFFSWDDRLKYRVPETLNNFSELLDKSILFYKFTQFIFKKQWDELKEVAKENGIKIIGDLPIFVNYDSVDTWVNPKLFCLDEDLLPIKVAGVPPDYFQETGQLWGNPLYDWDIHKQSGFKWWKTRFKHLFDLVDVVRIDHFRGFDEYWAVSFGSPNAIEGVWEKGPKLEFFNEVFAGEDFSIIAEDLGIITDNVVALRMSLGYPGMFVSHFHLMDKEKEDLLVLEQNAVIYTGTHDNQTSVSWFDELEEEEKEKIAALIDKKPQDFDNFDLIKICMSTNINTFMVPVQDLLELDDNARMNIPGTAIGNWRFKFKAESLTEDLARKLYRLNEKYNRL